MSKFSGNTGSASKDMEYLRELAEQKDRELESVIGAAADAVGKFACNPEFTVLYYTDGLAAMVGLSRGVVEKDGFNSSKYIHPDDIERVLKETEAAVAAQKPFSLYYRLKNTNGSIIWVKVKGIFLDELYEDRYPIAYFIYTDITEQKQREQELLLEKKKTQAALQSSDLLIWEYDINRKTAHHQAGKDRWRPLFRIIEKEPDVVIAEGMIHPDSVGDYKGLYRRMEAGAESAEAIIRMSGPDGRDIWLKIHYTIIFDENKMPVSAIGVAMDMTEYKEMERRYQEEMEYLGAVSSQDLIAKFRANITRDVTDNYSGIGKNIIPAFSRVYSETVKNIGGMCATKEMGEQFVKEMGKEHLMELFQNGKQEYSVEYQRRMKDGSLCWVKTYVRIFKAPRTGDITCFMYSYDIDTAKMNENAMRAVLNGNYDFVGIINVETGLLRCLSGAVSPFEKRSSFGYYEKAGPQILEALKENFEKEEAYQATEERMKMKRILAELESADTYEFNIKLWNQEHSALYTYHNTYRYLDEKKSQILVSRANVTNSLQEECLKQELLRSALNQAEEASHAKSDFLSRMSHEIRTPMNAIIGMSALAAQCVNDPEQVSDCLSKIGISARFLLSLINDILDMSRIESGHTILKNELIPFEEFIGGINAICYEQAAAKGVDYDALIMNYVEDCYMGDAMKLQQILINLISNAIKFTPSGGKVQLIISQQRIQSGKVHMKFTVNDTGIGISEEFKPKLFEPFEQENTGITSAYGGTGLGLAIVKNLVNMMGGNIYVNSILGVGTEFTVNVPLGLCEERLHDIRLRNEMNWSKLRALIVDDDVLVCENTQAILLDIGMQAEWVNSGSKAVDTVRKRWNAGKHYDIILVDWKMNDMDGIETTRRIRQIVGPDVTIIIMTAYDWASIEHEAKQAGVNILLSKPLFKTSLVSTFQRIYQEKEYKEQENIVEEYNFTGRRVLLVEDHVLNIEVAKRLLEAKGMAVEVVENGLAAIEAFTLAPLGYFDAILMDIRMPVMDGLTAAKAIRQLKKKSAAKIPIIAMSANAFDEDMEKSKMAGMNAHLAKPIEPQALYATLKEYMEEQWQEDLS